MGGIGTLVWLSAASPLRLEAQAGEAWKSNCGEESGNGKVSALEHVAPSGVDLDGLSLERARLKANVGVPHRRGWLVRRALLAADIGSLVLAFLVCHPK